jgi:hypothetical protein
MYKAQGPKWRESDRQNDIVSVGLRNVDTGSRHTSPWSRRQRRERCQERAEKKFFFALKRMGKSIPV